MKQLKTILFFLYFLFGIQVSNAFTYGGICYTKNSDGTSVTITYQEYWTHDNYSNINGSVNIPETVYYNGDTYTVTAIGDYAFTFCQGLTSVSIPNTVTSIGNYAFNCCSNLETLTIGNSVKSIGGLSFQGCRSMTSFNIPNSVVSIGGRAFEDCRCLTSVTIPSSVTSIGGGAFSGCTSLTSVIWNAKSCQDFESSYKPFTGSNNIASFDFGDSVERIPAYLCYGLNGLTTVTFPNSLISIGESAFKSCRNLATLTIPYYVTSIEKDAFSECSGLTSVFWEAKECNDFTSSTIPFSESNNITSFTFGNEVEKIPAYLCCGLNGLTSVSIPESVASIGNSAFYNCTGLTSVNISSVISWCNINFVSSYSNPLVYAKKLYLNGSEVINLVIANGIFSIKNYAFINCESLNSVTIPNSVTEIGERSFSNCTELTSINLPSSIGSIGASAFSGCACLTSINIPSSVSSIGASAFFGCTGLTNVLWNVISIEDFTSTSAPFVGSINIQSFAFGNTVERIPAYLCNGLTGLISTTIPASVISVGDYAFSGCTGLTSVTLPELATTIGTAAFQGCTGLTSVSIPNSVTSIDEYAFYNCSGLSTVTIPSSVTYIGHNAFSNCDSLTSIIWNAKQCDNFSYSDSYNPFYLSSNVKILTFGADVEKIPSYFCDGFARSLTNIYSHIDNPNNVTLGECCWGYFCVDFSNCILTVPAPSLGLYRTAYSWSGFLNIHPDVYVSSVILNNTELFLENGKTENLTATVLPTNAYSVLNWSSSNTSIATVDASGKVTAKSVGTATITATTTDGSNLSDTCQVQVYNKVSSVKLNYTSLIIEKGYSKQITATVSPSNAHNKKLLWSSSNPSVAEVDSTGLVTAINVGNTVISATTTDGSNITATCNVEVRAYANAVVLNKHETSMYAGGTEQLTAQVLPEDAYNKIVTWRTTNSTFASVNSSGLVMANKVGSALIIATCNGISDTCVVTVNGITSLILDKHELTLDIESTETLNATIEPQEAINKNLTWRSLNTSVAIVSSSGVITPKGIGSTRIIVQTTDGSNLSDTCVVTVIPTYDLYPTTTELTHVRGQSDFSAVIPFWMSNKTAISGLQFDITLPTGVSFATVDDYPDVWLDPTRKARNHSIDVSLISGSKYRVLVSSPTNNTFKGNEGEVLYMRLNIDSAHPIGSYYINTSNVIFVEPDETQHIGYNKSVQINYKYLLGDADGDARVDIADYTVTALYILNRPTEVFYSDAANVNGDYNINVTDLVGITNISLGIRPHEYRPAPAITMDNDTQEPMPSLNASLEGDNIVALSIDNDTPLAGMQLDLQLPQGMTLADATLEGRAAEYQLGTNTLADGRVRLLISSFGDKDIEAGNDAIIKLVLEGTNVNNEMLYITGAQAASRDLRSYELNDVTLPVGTTSIDDIGYSYDKLSIYGKGNTIVVNSPSAMTVQLVHVNGMVMPVEIKPGHNTIEVGGHGVYIIRVGNNVYKVRL